jgi:O6-methylguanine-DNA--protein-cysteine methyltransferase
VDENVIAFSNRYGGQQAVIVYNNSARPTLGVINSSVPFLDRPDRAKPRRRKLADALELSSGEAQFTIFKDYVSGLERIFNNKQLSTGGLSLKLEPYQVCAFLDIQQVDGGEAGYRTLAEKLKGAGVPSIAAAIQEIIDARPLSRG